MRRVLLLAAAGVLLAACADNTEIATFTDEHGRVCTAVVTVDGDDGDREASSIDCEYPPEGRTPGPETYRPMPDADE